MTILPLACVFNHEQGSLLINDSNDYLDRIYVVPRCR